MLPRLALVAIFATLTIPACSDAEDESPAGLEQLAAGNGPEAPIVTAEPDDYPLASASQTVTIDDIFYNIAGEVPGFAGLAVGQDQSSLDVFMADPSTSIEAIRVGLAKHLPTALQDFGDEIRTVPVRYGWRELYDWYQPIRAGGLPGTVTSDIDESANVLAFGVSDEDAAELARERLIELGIPADAFHIETGVAVEPVYD